MYKDSEKYVKNVLFFDLNNEEQPDTALIKNRITNEIEAISLVADKPALLCFDDFDPGFFEISLLKTKRPLHYFTLIKCFPLVVELTDIRSKYRISETIL